MLPSGEIRFVSCRVSECASGMHWNALERQSARNEAAHTERRKRRRDRPPLARSERRDSGNSV